MLVHNRKDMPGLPLAAEGDGRPSTTVKVHRPRRRSPAKGKAAAKDAAPAKEVAKESAKESARD